MKIMIPAISGLLLSMLLGWNAATAAEADSAAAIRKALTKIVSPGQNIEIMPAPIEGMSEVLLGNQVYYATNDGKYILQGNLIELATRTDLTEERLKGIRLALLDEVATQDMIVFAAPQERHVITVFTDIDCGYCRKLHREVGDYNKHGISVHYLSFPRSGLNSPSYKKAVAVWCSKDRNQAMTLAKNGETVPDVNCDNPVQKEYLLGQRVGIQGTPAIVLEDGSLLPGYVPADKLARELESRL